MCITASGDVNRDNDCAVAGETVVIRDPDAIDGGQLVTESSGELAVGATAEIEFAVNDVTGEAFQIQPHWFLLSYEPVDADVWGVISKWGCYEDNWSDCWNTDGTENTAADWDWRRRVIPPRARHANRWTRCARLPRGGRQESACPLVKLPAGRSLFAVRAAAVLCLLGLGGHSESP